MKRLFTALTIVLAATLSSCMYDDTSIWKAFSSLEQRLISLEELCRATNTNLDALNGIVEALTDNSEVQNISPVKSEKEVIGYTITFANGESITLYCGNARLDAGVGVPVITISKDDDGIYYWMLNGEWLLDADGNKLKVQGENSVIPTLTVDVDYWYISFDEGVTWTIADSTTAEETSCKSIVKSVEYDRESVYITLADDSLLVLPRVQKPHEYVDLGLTVKWAACNVGAYQPEEYGNYYAWGEIAPKSEYGWTPYSYWIDENGNNFVDYLECVDLGDITGNPAYDAATANWGAEWRMPTSKEQKELLENCTWEWTTQMGVSGMKVTGPNGNSIFLPAAGCNNGKTFTDISTQGYYWGTSPYLEGAFYAYSLDFADTGYTNVYWTMRCSGLPVRAVRE